MGVLMTGPAKYCSFFWQLDMGIPAMTNCCNELDACYDTCGRNKYDCDAKFRVCLHAICSDLRRSLGFVSKVQGEMFARFSAHFPLFCVDHQEM